MKSYPAKFKSFLWKIVQMGTLQEGREGVKWELGLALKWDLLTGTGI